ncbi:pao retrotransposon peptidase superfamily [Lasius niger]|uniref:Pao retrotransposon peptidase superfamily n=1 Tax=Lasius niger TaxID=67767 RepID=A0A0J7KDH1_LASNI|nr:pao retrotransposon peptidase superfamily [Lasius niger]
MACLRINRMPINQQVVKLLNSQRHHNLKPPLCDNQRALLQKKNGELHAVRLLIDQGSELSFISEDLVQSAQLKRTAASIPLLGIGGTYSGRTKGLVSIRLHSIHDANFNCAINAYVLPRLTAKLPPYDATSRSWPHITGLQLADPDFACSGLINIIVGSDNYGSVILPGLAQGGTSSPVAQQTIFGWVLSGTITTDEVTSSTQAYHCTLDRDLQELISRFWTQEELPASKTSKLTKDEEECERHFLSTHSRDATGRYIVRLPLKSDPTLLGDSKTRALHTLNRLTHRFSSNHMFQKLYSEFIEEYKNLGHMVTADIFENQVSPVYYLPHLGVLRENSRTTKLRVVFNGSSRTSSGLSLNNILHAGAKLQTDISEILLWTRTHKILFSTDIVKMFRQIAVQEDDWDLQRILWHGQDGRPVAYRLTTVTYGLNCAPFLALRTIQQLVNDEGHRFPKAIIPLTKELRQRWTSFRQQLQQLNQLSIPRWLGNVRFNSSVEIHGFSDASQLAITAVIYVRVPGEYGKFSARLVCSKTKIEPIKRLSIPRLELTAALLLTRLMTNTLKALELHEASVFCWTDSSVTLTWINAHPSRWRDFVHNRVSAIQDLLPNGAWRFVPGKENPADCATRGLTPDNLAQHELWWKGPSWLSNPQSSWPSFGFESALDADLEERPGNVMVAAARQTHYWELLDRYSSFTKLIRVTTLCRRFISCLRKILQSSPLKHPLTPMELEQSRKFWIRNVQKAWFSYEMGVISRKEQLPKSHSLVRLTPFLDQEGLLRVGGRLHNAQIDSESKHPFILPRRSPLTIHIEVVTDYTTDAFIAAYKRFTGRRGICATLQSDCGTNFVGADAELKRQFKSSSKELHHLASLLANDNTIWRFNPPSAPHFGGKWEAAVKSTKFHLQRVLKDTVLTYEEMTTITVQIEAVLNSRPLCPLSDDANDYSALTPGHFLIGEAPTAIPEPNLSVEKTSRLTRWQLLRQKVDHFWSRWTSECLQRYQAVSKWHHPSNEIKEGSMVLITDERYPPGKWPLARVTHLHPGPDGLTRVVTVKTATSTYKRPIAKLCVLPTDPDAVNSTNLSSKAGGNVKVTPCVTDMSPA